MSYSLFTEKIHVILLVLKSSLSFFNLKWKDAIVWSRRVAEGGVRGANAPVLRKSCPLFVPQKIKPWQKWQSIFKRDEYDLIRKVFCVTARNVYFIKYMLYYHGVIILNRSNNSMFLYLKIYWNQQVFDLIRASGIWMKPETLRHQASSSKF